MQQLLKGTFAYRRIVSKSDNKKQEINTLNIETPEEMGFYKYFVYLDSELLNLIFYKKDNLNILNESTEISTQKMEKTLVSKLTKNIIMVHQFYRSLIKQKIDPDKYFNENKEKFENQNSKIKFLMNKFFMMTIKLQNEDRIELIFLAAFNVILFLQNSFRSA